MKQVIAIIRINMMNQTKQALAEAGFPAFTVRKVLGRGKGNVDFRIMHGAGEGSPEAIAHLKDDGTMLVPKRLINVLVNDCDVSRLVSVLIKTNQTGRHGDGKIFVINATEVIRVRTGEQGASALC